MNVSKKLGIWMCHSSVHLMEFNSEISDEQLKKKLEAKNNIPPSSVNMQDEAYLQQTESFKKLGVAIEKYNEVVLFGPIDTKVEFMKFIHADRRFENIKIDVRQTNEMGEDQQQTFVDDYFATQ